MNSINTLNSKVHINETAYAELNSYLKNNIFSKYFIISDENTNIACVEKFKSQLNNDLNFEAIVIPSGEIHKSITTCNIVWETLSEHNADRKALIINIGGGVITDLGGFVASTFKRGVKFINVPTSLLAMVDASVGGKTGVDLGLLKNQVGVVNFPEMVLIDTSFLNSLPTNHYRSGLAEMLKHGLITSKSYWDDTVLYINEYNGNVNDQLIYDSILIKHNVVTQDPYEDNLRKTLNYGHTLGHAIESYLLDHENLDTLLHGEAIAVGLVLETFISHKLKGFPETNLSQVKSVIHSLFGRVQFDQKAIETIIELLKFDKKNSFGNINFVLLSGFGEPAFDCQVSNELIFDAFNYYNS